MEDAHYCICLAMLPSVRAAARTVCSAWRDRLDHALAWPEITADFAERLIGSLINKGYVAARGAMWLVRVFKLPGYANVIADRLCSGGRGCDAECLLLEPKLLEYALDRCRNGIVKRILVANPPTREVAEKAEAFNVSNVRLLCEHYGFKPKVYSEHIKRYVGIYSGFNPADVLWLRGQDPKLGNMFLPRALHVACMKGNAALAADIMGLGVAPALNDIRAAAENGHCYLAELLYTKDVLCYDVTAVWAIAEATKSNVWFDRYPDVMSSHSAREFLTVCEGGYLRAAKQLWRNEYGLGGLPERIWLKVCQYGRPDMIEFLMVQYPTEARSIKKGLSAACMAGRFDNAQVLAEGMKLSHFVDAIGGGNVELIKWVAEKVRPHVALIWEGIQGVLLRPSFDTEFLLDMLPSGASVRKLPVTLFEACRNGRYISLEPLFRRFSFAELGVDGPTLLAEAEKSTNADLITFLRSVVPENERIVPTQAAAQQ